jgi:hypothetical protein
MDGAGNRAVLVSARGFGRRSAKAARTARDGIAKLTLH